MLPKAIVLFVLALLAIPVAVMDESEPPTQLMVKGFARMVRGNFDDLDEFTSQPDRAIPFLLAKSAKSKASVRVTALDVLTRVDLADNGVVDRPEVIAALTAGVAPTETADGVVDEALRGLEFAVDGGTDPDLLADHLQLRVEQGWPRAMKVLGRVGSPERVPDLLPYLESPDPAMVKWTRCALARLGEPTALDEILLGLEVEGPGRNETFELLAYVGDPSTAARVATYLGRPDGPADTAQDVRHTPYRVMAAWALGSIVREPPLRLDVGQVGDAEVAVWRTWWAEHADEYPDR